MTKSLSPSEQIFPLRSATSGRHVPFLPPPRFQNHPPPIWRIPHPPKWFSTSLRYLSAQSIEPPPPRIQTHSPTKWASPPSIGTDFLPRSAARLFKVVSFTHQEFHPDFPQRELSPVVLEAITLGFPSPVFTFQPRSPPLSPCFFPKSEPLNGNFPADFGAVSL